jgi:hypothetical protein
MVVATDIIGQTRKLAHVGDSNQHCHEACLQVGVGYFE